MKDKPATTGAVGVVVFQGSIVIRSMLSWKLCSFFPTSDFGIMPSFSQNISQRYSPFLDAVTHKTILVLDNRAATLEAKDARLGRLGHVLLLLFPTIVRKHKASCTRVGYTGELRL